MPENLSLHRLARRHCSAMIATKTHAVRPLEDVDRIIKLGASGSGWSTKLSATRLLQKILQVRSKFVFIQTLMKNRTFRSSTILQRISSRRARSSNFTIQVLKNMCVRLGRCLTNLQDFPLNVAASWSQFTRQYLKGQNPESVDEWIIFMSRFNDIEWEKKGNTETCLHNANEVAAFATQFKPGASLAPSQKNT